MPIIEKKFILSLDNDTQNETVVLFSLKKNTPKIEVTMEPDEESNYTPQEKATYSKIKEYVKDKYSVNVHTYYMASTRRKIENNPAKPEYILTETGIDYRMRERDK